MRKLFIFLTLLILSVVAQKNYTDFVVAMKSKISTAPHKHAAWERLAQLTDTYGPRMWGSVNLEYAINHMKKWAIEQGFQNVRLEPVVNFTKWVRGKESLQLLTPRRFKLDVIGLGASVPGSMTAQVVVVSNYQELENMAALGKVQGKIVCYNNKWIDYQHSVTYRVDGPSYAAKYGAVATLVRSIASSSIYSVHTGYMQYNLTISPKKIPCAAITVQDAEMFARIQERGDKITVNLVLESQMVDNSSSSNLIFQIVGATYPDQIILAGGHIDSWDTGSQTGANDDGGGFMTVFEALRLLKKNGFRPKRTLRFIAWSGQQSGSYVDGAAQYITNHKAELAKHVATFQSDQGSTLLRGIAHLGPGKQIVQGILTNYMTILNASQYSDKVVSIDTEGMIQYEIPRFSNIVNDTADHSFYFRYHHSAGDTMSIMNPDEMDSNVVGIASFLFIIADLDQTVRDVTGRQNLRVFNNHRMERGYVGSSNY